jgi:signal transduction histidine kinase
MLAVEPMSDVRATAEPESERRGGLRDLIGSTLAVSADATIAQASRLFEQHPQADSLAVLDDARLGILVRTRFYLQLGRRFGYALFENRAVRLLAEEGSTVEADADPVEVITLATQRSPERIYDDLLVVEQGRYLGTVSLRSLLAHHKDLLVASMAEVALLDERNRRLHDVQRLQSEFVANMTHELRAPLHALLAGVDVLAGEPTLPASLQPSVRALGTRAQDVLAIVDNLLDLARLEAGAVDPLEEPTDLAALCDEALAAVEPLVERKGLRIEREYLNLARPIVTDPVLLRRVVDNLLSNAVKFTDAGAIVLFAARDAGALTLRVRDTGVGIHAVDLERLFTRFSQLEAARTKRRPGTGLGLAIVKGLVERLGGSVGVVSRENVGSIFTVSLPAGVERAGR